VNIIQWINLNLKDKKVLIIDEIDDTRKTMDFCVKELVEKNNANDMCVFVWYLYVYSLVCRCIYCIPCVNIY
jgi:hypoxanthine phosphoribosyltransferase